MGSHGQFMKGRMHDEAIHLPLVMRYPAVIKPGTVVDEMVSMIDLAPTLLDLMDAPIPDPVSGRSAVSLLRGEKVPDWPDCVFLSHRTTRGIRTHDWTYLIHESGEPTLFDQRNDWLELHNHVNEPDNREVVNALHKRLVDWLEAAGEPFAETAQGPNSDSAHE